MGFTFRHLQPADPYFAAWQEKRRRTHRTWMAFAAFPIASLALSALCFAIWKSDGFPWVLLPGGLVLVALRVHQCIWPCPRCGSRFYVSWYIYRPFANSCLHCGLLEYASDGSFEQEASTCGQRGGV